MFELMYAAKGIGLAANQVALPYRLFLLNLTADPENKEEEKIFINPQIIKRRGQATGEEGCLSFPEMYGPVDRSDEIVIESFDLQGNLIRYELNDLASRAVQHENDHIDGVLFIDRMSEQDRSQVAPLVDDFELQFRQQQQQNLIPDDDELTNQVKALANMQRG